MESLTRLSFHRGRNSLSGVSEAMGERGPGRVSESVGWPYSGEEVLSTCTGFWRPGAVNCLEDSWASECRLGAWHLGVEWPRAWA